MTTYDLIVNIIDPAIVDLLAEAKYDLCLGVLTKANQIAFPSTPIERISLTGSNQYRTKWLGPGYHDYYMTVTTARPKDRKKDDFGTEYPLFPVEFGDICQVSQSGDAEIADETVPFLNGFRFQNETIASPVLYRTLKGEGTIHPDDPLCAPPLWVPGTGQLEVLENSALLWLEARGSENGVEWYDESTKLPVTFTTDKDTIVEIGADGRLKMPDIKIPPVISNPVNPVDLNKPIDLVGPVDPDGPDKPIDPIDPVVPDKPINPIDPVDPNKPLDPIDPVDPANRVNPAGSRVPASRVVQTSRVLPVKPKRKTVVNGVA